MATPVSKKVQMDRKSSFLDNVVSEDQQRKEKAKKADKIREKPPGKSGGQCLVHSDPVPSVNTE